MTTKTEHHLAAIAKLCSPKAPARSVSPGDIADLALDPEPPAEVEDVEQESVEKAITVGIAKASEEQQTVTGVVLQPEIVDGHGDIMSAKVIQETAFKFLANFNRTTKLGVQHSIFKAGQLDLVESFLAPMDMAIGSKVVKSGSWIMTMKVLDKKLWEKVKKGEITGFSIGGIAKAIPLEDK